VIQRATVRKNQYQDSVRLMTISREAGAVPGVDKVLALLGTDSNKRLVKGLGLLDAAAEGATANDLLICVAAETDQACEAGLARVDALLRREVGGLRVEAPPHSLEEAVARLPGANIALFSVPGPFAKLDVVRALEDGLHVMLFSDNISIEDEVFLKELAVRKGRLLMGPDCGTAIVNGVPLALANVVRRGEIGVVGASGTGIQELTCLLDRFGHGITHALGVGGRDLKKAVGGRMIRLALRMVAEDPGTRRIVLVAKPGDPEVTREVLREAGALGMPVVACMLGGATAAKGILGVTAVDTLEEAALAATGKGPAGKDDLTELHRAAARLPATRRWLRALYSGGTLAYETLLIAEGRLDLPSNIAWNKALRLEYPARAEGHCCVDLGEDEFTQGRPHPMIDFALRAERIVEALRDPAVRILLLDVVLGHGAHPDPAGEIAKALVRGRDGLAPGEGPLVLAHVCGTEADPQPLSVQEEALRRVGVHLFPSNAQAARAAIALVAGEGRRG
jgi:FdrA protein